MRSLTGVSRVMMVRREPPAPTPPPEYLYFPATLKQICCSLIIRANIPSSSLPEELRVYIEELRAKGSDPFEMKLRSCAQEDLGGAINIGRFQDYPNILMEPQPTPGKIFATNLIEQASAVIQFLSKLDKKPLLKEKTVLERALHFRYLAFLSLQGNLITQSDLPRSECFSVFSAEALPSRLIPPADVSIVWFCHMLQSLQYDTFIKK